MCAHVRPCVPVCRRRYMSSLALRPYDTSTLGNLAMAHLKLSAFEEALDFADRAIYLEGVRVAAEQ